MKPRLPHHLRRQLLASFSLSLVLFSATAQAGVIRDDYDLQLYKDFALNQGMFRPGATHIEVFKKDGKTSYSIPLMPNLDAYGNYFSHSSGNGGGGLVAPQFFITATHVGAPKSNDSVFNILSSSGSEIYKEGVFYHTAGYATYEYDGMTVRLDKIVTEVSYIPICTDSSLISSMHRNGSLLFRLGIGKTSWANSGGGTTPISNSPLLGGLLSPSNVISNFKSQGNYRIAAILNKSQSFPLGIGEDSGDSGSPLYVYNPSTRQFETVGVASTSTGGGYGNYTNFEFHPSAIQSKMDFFNDPAVASSMSGEAILWNAQGSMASGTLTQNETSWTYHGLADGSSDLIPTRGLVFSSAAERQDIILQGNINMGAGSLTFREGNYAISSADDGGYRVNSAGFIIEKGASVATTYSGTTSDEWRKVGEGTLTIQGSGNHGITLNVGGGNMLFDENGDIIHSGEVRLDRADGYAARTIKLNAGVASIVLMRDGQINGASSFSFGNMGGLLNLNGHDLSWNVINHADYGATIGSIRLADAAEAPEQSVFAYTGTGTFKGGFTDGGNAEDGLLKVVYQGPAASSTWTLTGISDNAGGYEINQGNLTLKGSLTSHVNYTNYSDWTYAALKTGSVTVNNGGTFTLGSHAFMQGDVIVNEGTFIMNQTVDAARESISGSSLQDVTDFISLNGNVFLNSAEATMKAATGSPVALTYAGSIQGSGNFIKTGSGTLKLEGENTFTGSKTVEAGAVEIAGAAGLGANLENRKWLIQEAGSLGLHGAAEEMLQYVDGASAGVLALGKDTAQQLDMSGHEALIIGALGNISYGAAGTSEELQAVNGQWKLGGGGGTLTVNFKLTGANDLIVGNEFSKGTVIITNTANDFSGDIIIGGAGNSFNFTDDRALGKSRIFVDYGNEINILSGSLDMLRIMKEGSSGVLALSSAEGTPIHTDLDLVNNPTECAIGAIGTATYTGAITPGAQGYRFGGKGTLILDTVLSGNGSMTLDGQGQTGGSIVFARENDFTGSITAGGEPPQQRFRQHRHPV